MIPRHRGWSSAELVPCTIDIAHSRETLHAHVDLGDIEVRPGDRVLVLSPPAVREGKRMVCHRRAGVIRAGVLTRLWTRLRGSFDIAPLLEVGFSTRRTP